jgi:hypothetical protein
MSTATLQKAVEDVIFGSAAASAHAPEGQHQWARERAATHLIATWVGGGQLCSHTTLRALLSSKMQEPRCVFAQWSYVEAACFFGRIFSYAARISAGIAVLDELDSNASLHEQISAVVDAESLDENAYVRTLVSVMSGRIRTKGLEAVTEPSGAPGAVGAVGTAGAVSAVGAVGRSTTGKRFASRAGFLNLSTKAKRQRKPIHTWTMSDEFFHFARGVQAYFSRVIVFKSRAYTSNDEQDNLYAFLNDDLFKNIGSLSDDEEAFSNFTAKLVNANSIIICRSQDDSVVGRVGAVLQRYIKIHGHAIHSELKRVAMMDVDSAVPTPTPEILPPGPSAVSSLPVPQPVPKAAPKEKPTNTWISSLPQNEELLYFEYERKLVQATVQASTLPDSNEALGVFYSDLGGNIKNSQENDLNTYFRRTPQELIDEVDTMSDQGKVDLARNRTLAYGASFPDTKSAPLPRVLIDTRVWRTAPTNEDRNYVVKRLADLQFGGQTFAPQNGYHFIAADQLSVLRSLATYLTRRKLGLDTAASQFQFIGQGNKNIALGYNPARSATFYAANNVAAYMPPFHPKRDVRAAESKDLLAHTVLRLPSWIETGHTMEEGLDMIFQYLQASNMQCGAFVSGAILFHISSLVDVNEWNNEEEARKRARKEQPNDGLTKPEIGPVQDQIEKTLATANQFGVLFFVERLPLTDSQIVRSPTQIVGAANAAAYNATAMALWNLLLRMSRAGLLLFDFHLDNVMFYKKEKSGSYEARLIDFDAIYGSALTRSQLIGTSDFSKAEAWKPLYVLNVLVFLTILHVDLNRESLKKAFYTVSRGKSMLYAIDEFKATAKDLFQRFGEQLKSNSGAFNGMSLPIKLLAAPWLGGFKGTGENLWAYENATLPATKHTLEGFMARGESLYDRPDSPAVTLEQRLMYGLRHNLYHNLVKASTFRTEKDWITRQSAVERYIRPVEDWNPTIRIGNDFEFLKHVLPHAKEQIGFDALNANTFLRTFAPRLLAIRKHATQTRAGGYTVAEMMADLCIPHNNQPLPSATEATLRNIQAMPAMPGFNSKYENINQPYRQAISNALSLIYEHDGLQLEDSSPTGGPDHEL